MSLVLEHSVEFDFEVVDAVQEDPEEHGQEDRQVEEHVHPPGPGAWVCVDCIEVDSAADYQESILDAV